MLMQLSVKVSKVLNFSVGRVSNLCPLALTCLDIELFLSLGYLSFFVYFTVLFNLERFSWQSFIKSLMLWASTWKLVGF